MRRWSRARSVVLAAAIGATLAPRLAAAGEEAPSSALAVQAGWWSVEGEWRTRAGVFLAVGVPWVGAALAMGSAVWLVPYGGRVGYQHETWRRWKLRAGVHVAGTYGREDPCGDCGEMVSRTFGFVELGVRYEGASGLVAGLDLPVFGVGNGRDLYPPPVSLAFTQAYVGFSWRL
jgi:hypothetical protein